MGKPVFFFQQRLGQYGKAITIIKFRTMHLGEIIGRSYQEKARIPLLGRIMRSYHIDELPQLFMIISGKMSLVGPRPLLSEHLIGYKRIDLRQSVKPGLMCFAQSKLYRERFLDKEEQISFDLHYVSRASLRVDIYIVYETIILHIKKMFS